jgi:hypothetical protein
MRLHTSIFASLLAAILLCASIAVTPAQDGSGRGAQADAGQTYDSISFAGTESEISDAALVPRQLALAAEQTGCHYKHDIKELPIHLIRAENPNCASVLSRRSWWIASRIRLCELAKPEARGDAVHCTQ